MLVLSRAEDEELFIGEEIRLMVIRVKGGKVRIGVEAPSHLKILRAELKPGYVKTPRQRSKKK